MSLTAAGGRWEIVVLLLLVVVVRKVGTGVNSYILIRVVFGR